MNFVLGFVVLVILVAAQEGAITSKTIYSIENDALCGQTGLQAGDEIVAVNGRRCLWPTTSFMSWCAPKPIAPGSP